jgi:hypothetical protein
MALPGAAAGDCEVDLAAPQRWQARSSPSATRSSPGSGAGFRAAVVDAAQLAHRVPKARLSPRRAKPVMLAIMLEVSA